VILTHCRKTQNISSSVNSKQKSPNHINGTDKTSKAAVLNQKQLMNDYDTDVYAETVSDLLL
jgi:hypothetical protein